MDQSNRKHIPVREQSFVVVQKDDFLEEDNDVKQAESVSTEFHFYPEQRKSPTESISSKIQNFDCEKVESYSDDSDFEILKSNEFDDVESLQENASAILNRNENTGNSKPLQPNNGNQTENIQDKINATTKSEENYPVDVRHEPISELDFSRSLYLSRTSEQVNIKEITQKSFASTFHNGTVVFPESSSRSIQNTSSNSKNINVGEQQIIEATHTNQKERISGVDSDSNINSATKIRQVDTQDNKSEVNETISDNEKYRLQTEEDKYRLSSMNNRENKAALSGEEENEQFEREARETKECNETKPTQGASETSYSENELSMDTELRKSKSQRSLVGGFGIIELFKVGKFWLISLNGKKSKLPKNINQDSNLKIKEHDGNCLLLTDEICYALKVIDDSIVLEESASCKSGSFAGETNTDANKGMSETTIIPQDTKKCQDGNYVEIRNSTLGTSMIESICTGVDEKIIDQDEPCDVKDIKNPHSDGLRLEKPAVTSANTIETDDANTLIARSESDDPPDKQVIDNKNLDRCAVGPLLPDCALPDSNQSINGLNIIETLQTSDSSANETNNVDNNRQTPYINDTTEQKTDNELLKQENSPKEIPVLLAVEDGGRKVRGSFGNIQLIKVGKFWLISYNGKKSKLPKDINQDGTLQLRVKNNLIFLVTGSVCYTIIPSQESITLEENKHDIDDSSNEYIVRVRGESMEKERLQDIHEKQPVIGGMNGTENIDHCDTTFKQTTEHENKRKQKNCQSPKNVGEKEYQGQYHDRKKESQNVDRAPIECFESDKSGSEYPIASENAGNKNTENSTIESAFNTETQGNIEAIRPSEDVELPKMFSSMQISDQNKPENIDVLVVGHSDSTQKDIWSINEEVSSPIRNTTDSSFGLLRENASAMSYTDQNKPENNDVLAVGHSDSTQKDIWSINEEVSSPIRNTTDSSFGLLRENASAMSYTDEKIKVVCKVRYQIESEEQDWITKTFHMSFRINDYMKWMFFINSPIQRSALSYIDINQVKFEVSLCPDEVSILTPLKQASQIQTIVQVIKSKVLSLTHDVIIVDITAEVSPSKEDIQQLKESKSIDNKEWYLENINGRDLLACHCSQKQSVFGCVSVLTERLTLTTANDSPTSEKMLKIKVQLPLKVPWSDIFHRFNTFKVMGTKFPSVQLRLMSEPSLHVQMHGPQNVVSAAKTFLENFVSNIDPREIKLIFQKRQVFKETKLCEMINHEINKNVLFGLIDDRPFVFCLNEVDFKEASLKICLELVSEEEVQLTDWWRDEDAISYLKTTHCSEQEGVLITVDPNKIKIFITGWKSHVAEVSRNFRGEIKYATKQQLFEALDKGETKTTCNSRTLRVQIRDDQTLSLLELNKIFLDKLEKKYNVLITSMNDEQFMGLLIRGSDENASRCKTEIDEFVNCITSETITFGKSIEILTKKFQTILDRAYSKNGVLLNMKVQLQSAIYFLDRGEYNKEWEFPNGGKVVLLNSDKTKIGSYYIVDVNEATTERNGYTASVIGEKLVIKMEQPALEDDPKPFRRTQEIVQKIMQKAENDREEAIAFHLRKLHSWNFNDLLRSWLAAFEDFFVLKERSKLKFILLFCQTDGYKECLQPFIEEMKSLSLDRMYKLQHNRCLKITLIKGKLDEISADIIVNTASPNLDLTKGAVSYAISRRAGPELQTEIRKCYPNGITPGEVAVTKGHNLRCYKVYHGALHGYNFSKEDEIARELRMFIFKCLKKADESNAKKIAFPAIGTGNLKYPLEFVVNHMFDIVKTFGENNPNTSISEVLFVVFDQDARTCQAFEKRQREEERSNRGRPSPKDEGNQSGCCTIHVTGHRDSVERVVTIIRSELSKSPVKEQSEVACKAKSYSDALKSSTATPVVPPRSAKPGRVPSTPDHIKNAFTCQTNEGLIIKVYNADIFNLPVDCIVHPDRDATHKSDRSKVGKAFKSEDSKLQNKCVIHAVGPSWYDYHPFTVENVKACQEDLKRAITGALGIANRAFLTTIAVPAISSGSLAVPKKLCAIQYVEAITAFSSSELSHMRTLKEVHFVDVSRPTLDFIREAFVVMVQKKLPAPWNFKIYCTKESYLAGQQCGVHSEESRDEWRTVPYYIEDKNAVNCKFTQTKMVTISYGDILEFNNADALVCSEDQSGQAVGGVAKLLQDKGGLRYLDEKQHLFKQTRPVTGDVIITSGGITGYKWIMHAIMPHKAHFNQAELKWKQSLTSMLDQIFETIETRRFQSVVMSLLGTGLGGSEPGQCAKILIESFEKYSVTYRDSFLYLNVVNNDRTRNTIVMQLFKDHITQIKKYSSAKKPSYQESNRHSPKDHPSPGNPYKGIVRNAYLPDNKDGREVCTLLKLAFERRLVFTIGTSRTPGEQGVVTWNDIHHKTDLTPYAIYGYPDSGYLNRVKRELADKGVTSSDPDFDRSFLDKLNRGPLLRPVTIRVPPFLIRESSV